MVSVVGMIGQVVIVVFVTVVVVFVALVVVLIAVLAVVDFLLCLGLVVPKFVVVPHRNCRKYHVVTHSS